MPKLEPGTIQSRPEEDAEIERLPREDPDSAPLTDEEWKAMTEEAEDIADAERFDREDDGFRVPHAVILAIHEGQHPVRAWREHRGLTQEALAAAAGISTPFLSQIEGGKRVGSLDTLRAVARALDVPLDLVAAGAGGVGRGAPLVSAATAVHLRIFCRLLPISL